MKTYIFKVFKNNTTIKCFDSLKDAVEFIETNNLEGCDVKAIVKEETKKVTDSQKDSVKFCEDMLYISFKGDIENYSHVSSFLSEYLQDAERIYDELKCEYEAYLNDLYD